MKITKSIILAVLVTLSSNACAVKQSEEASTKKEVDNYKSKHAALVDHIYTADPSAHVFNDKLYIYPSHDIDSGIPTNDNADHFAMRDYRVLSMEKVGGNVTEHGVALSIEDIPWAGRQLWAPDAATKNGKFYLYFPAKNKDDVFYLGVAISDSPTGPFKAQPEPIKGSFSIDPSVYEDDDGSHYIYFGGIWGGQLQRWENGKYTGKDNYPADNEPALRPRVAKLSDDMLSLDGDVKEIEILDKSGSPILHGDNDRRFFEAAWIHKVGATYYFSYSTGDTHKIVYATGDNPMGPFTYQGVVLNPVIGWTNHHSITEFDGKWYLFYHDSTLSGGKTHLRSVKMAELEHLPDGTIKTIDAYEQ